MGTNYYLTIGGNKLHLGKSSGGWVFALHVYPELGINNFEDMLTVIRTIDSLSVYRPLSNEYDEPCSIDRFICTVTEREGKYIPRSELKAENFYEQNHAEQGPKNLIRSKVDGRHCIGHGPGTYSYHIGEFS